jgi:hypothetical protein
LQGTRDAYQVCDHLHGRSEDRCHMPRDTIPWRCIQIPFHNPVGLKR